MPERYSEHETDDEQGTLEERLSAYYGPALPEQSLPLSSWSHLSSQLSPRRPSRPWLRPKWQRATQAFPFNVQERLTHIAFQAAIQERIRHIAFQADMPRVTQSVQWTFQQRVDVPFVSVSLFKRRAIRLTLPAQGGLSLSQAELDVLIASGVARYKYAHKTTNTIVQLLISALLLLPLLAISLILVFWRTVPTPVALSLIGSLCVLNIPFFWLLGYRARQTARRADVLVVQWIGREQTCQGLHALAARSHTPSRKRWGELSLNERIHAVCYTPVAVEDEHFTLVR